jgi:acetolactate synthase-1/2/3 large subunit
MIMGESPTCPAADLLVRRLRDYGVSQIFGYPGGQITPIYDALYREPAVRHRLARDEQAAAFMADGYARASGKPGVCLAVCGPGVFNTFTPLASAYTDSIPILLISGQVPSAGRGPRSGYYHENDQLGACASITKWRGRVDSVEQLIPLLDQAWTRLTTGRPGPVFLEIPLDILRAPANVDHLAPLPEPMTPPAPSAAELAALAQKLEAWRRPLLMVGGGVVSSGAEKVVGQLAERLGAPVIHTAMGKCAFPNSHPLAAGMPWHRATSDLTTMASFMSPLFTEADGLLVLGCRFTQLATGSWSLRLPASVIQVDIDPEELGRHYPVQVGLAGDVRATLTPLLQLLPAQLRRPWATLPPRGEPWRLPGLDILAPLRRALPEDAILVADVTRLAYILMAEFPLNQPRTFLHPAGAVAMGFGIPAALGAKAAFPDRPVVAVVGDGCFLMSAMELATAVQEELAIVVLLINDSTLTLIKATQQRRYQERYIAVDLRNPDFATFCQAFGVAYWRADTDADLDAALSAALRAGRPALVEVRLKS